MIAMRPMAPMTLSELLAESGDAGAAGDVPVTGLALDSRLLEPGDCFIALAGAREHGIRYAGAVAAAGAAAILADDVDVPPHVGIPVIRVAGLRRQLGSIAARFYGYPSRQMRVIAVTGTNGKTTVAHLCADALRTLHGQCAYFGTLGTGLFGALTPGANTTPDPVLLQRGLAGLRATGCGDVALEASSHALDQGRLNGLEVGVAIFTGLSHDHLDYHGSFEAYGRAKQRLFAHAGLHTAVINVDDDYAPQIVAAVTPGVRVMTYSAQAAGPRADFQAEAIDCDGRGSRVRVRTPAGVATLDSPLVGDFNVQNLLAALGALLAVGTPLAAAEQALSKARPVRGRMELACTAPCVYVDYAHSPDSLERVLATLRRLTRGRLICVFGCGGDRDVAKRPLMGAIAERDADHVIVTSDNPRSEDPREIARQILAGMRNPVAATVELDRAAAIARAVAEAGPDDAILVAGKGHETTQTVAGESTPFDDVAVVRRAVEARHD
jgi:UDP-N-acetylmuramoyl-L-alanyl-D-glutamate--2,6-diaminopimelate ligase